MSTYACALAVPALLTAGALSHGLAVLRLPTGPEALALLYLGVFVTAGGFVAWYAGLQRLGLERAGLFAGLVPVSALAAAVALGTSLATRGRVGGAILVSVGVVLGVGAGRRGESLG